MVELLPRGAHAVLLTFEADPPPKESGLPPALAAALAAALCASGIVAARWFEAAPPPTTARFLPAPERGVLQRLRSLLPLQETWPASLALTRDPACAAVFFETGWDLQYQAMLLLPEDAEQKSEAALAALRTTRDWRDFADLGTVLALCAPAVDGAAVLIACHSAERLSEVAATLNAALQTVVT
jgi:hypothetical protein